MQCLGQEGLSLVNRPPIPDMTDAKPGFRGNKAALPSKTCVACGLAMAWRRRWAKTWSEVKYCSEACRRKGSSRG